MKSSFRSMTLSLLFGVVVTALASACGSGDGLKAEDGATLAELEYEFSVTVEPRADEPVAGKITIDTVGAYREEIYTAVNSREVRSSTAGQLNEDQLTEVLRLIEEGNFERYADSGGFCTENDEYRLSILLTNGAGVNGIMNHEGFNGDPDGECGSTNSLKGDLRPLHEYLIKGIQESFLE